MTSPVFRNEAENKQGLSKRLAFTRILTTNDSEVIVDITKHMSEVHQISLVCEKDLYINFDGDATSSTGSDGTINSFLLEGGESYSDSNIFIKNKITAINASTDVYGEIRGVIWGR